MFNSLDGAAEHRGGLLQSASPALQLFRRFQSIALSRFPGTRRLLQLHARRGPRPVLNQDCQA